MYRTKVFQIGCALVSPVVAKKGPYFVIQVYMVVTWLNSAIGLFLGHWVGYVALIPTLVVERFSIVIIA